MNSSKNLTTGSSVVRYVCTFLTSILMSAIIFRASPAFARIERFPADFKIQRISTKDVTIYVRVGGNGPAVVMLHGFADTGDMWAPLAKALYKNHTVIVPDLRGMGLSSQPAGGYDKKTQATDVALVLDALKVDKVAVVSHDIGNMVAYAFAAQYSGRVAR